MAFLFETIYIFTLIIMKMCFNCHVGRPTGVEKALTYDNKTSQYDKKV